MNRKLAGIQKAFEEKPQTATAAPARKTARRPKGSGASQIAPSREGKLPLIAYLSPAYKRSLKLIQAKQETPRSNQDLIAEALNMLFEHYKVPTVAE